MATSSSSNRSIAYLPGSVESEDTTTIVTVDATNGKSVIELGNMDGGSSTVESASLITGDNIITSSSSTPANINSSASAAAQRTNTATTSTTPPQETDSGRPQHPLTTSDSNSSDNSKKDEVSVRVNESKEKDAENKLATNDGWADPRNVTAPEGMIHPNNPHLVTWSTIMMGFAIYNTVTIPYRWAFWEDPVYLTWDVVLMVIADAIGDICFFIEVWKNFHTGYLDDGAVVWDKAKIRDRYLRSWFILDLVTCLPFDIMQAGFGKLVPAVRVPKILRLFQVMHHVNYIEMNRSVSLEFRMAKLLFYTGVIALFAGCIKYPIMMKNASLEPFLLERTAFGRFLLSVYWSTGALIDRGDTNNPIEFNDYLLSVSTMFIGVLWVAYFIASLDQFVDSNGGSKAKFQDEVKQVSKFMHQFKLPKSMQDKVKAYYSYLWSSTQRFDANELIKDLPSALQADLKAAFTCDTIQNSDIFQGVSGAFIAHIVQTVTVLITIPGEIICSIDHVALEMYFIQDGEIDILVGPKRSLIATLRTGEHFGEYALFVSEVRTATARSSGYANLLILSKDAIESAFKHWPAAESIIQQNATELQARTDQQERIFLDIENQKVDGQMSSNAKLMKLINVERAVAAISTRWTISPSDTNYLRWQAAYIAFVFWNSVLIPLRFAFVPDSTNAFILTVDYIGDLFMIIDIFLSFRVRYIAKGNEVSNVPSIQRHYFYGWFWLHVAASIPLDFAMIGIGMEPFLRLNRVLRLIHVHDIINQKMKESKHEDVLALLYLIANLLFLSHWAASIYFAFTRWVGFGIDGEDPVTLLAISTESRWQPSLAIGKSSVVYQYIRSQFFSMGLLTGVGGTVYPPNNAAVIFTLGVMLLGLFFVSNLIGLLGNLTLNLQRNTSEASAESEMVTEALEYRKIDPSLQRRVEDYLKHVWMSQKGTNPNDCLAKLPIQLRTDIMLFICEALIRQVPRFKDMDDHFIRALVGELTFVELPAGEFVFKQGHVGDAMYFISKGLLDIVFDNGSEDVVVKTIGPGSFFGEGALFSGTRSASVRANIPVLLFSLSETSFSKVMHMHPAFAESLMHTHEARHNALLGKVDLKPKAPGSTPTTGRRSSAAVPQQAKTPRRSLISDGSGGNGGEKKIVRSIPAVEIISPTAVKKTQLAAAAAALIKASNARSEKKGADSPASKPTFKRLMSNIKNSGMGFSLAEAAVAAATASSATATTTTPVVTTATTTAVVAIVPISVVAASSSSSSSSSSSPPIDLASPSIKQIENSPPTAFIPGDSPANTTKWVMDADEDSTPTTK